MSREKWCRVIIDTFEGYEISDCGRIKRNGNILAVQEDKDGYLVIVLTQNQIKKLVKIHRLVAEYFVENTNSLNIVNHKDGNKKNNHYSNLEWTTVKANTQHAYDTGLYKSIKKVVIEFNDGSKKIFSTCRMASRELSVPCSTLSGILNGTRTGTKTKIKFNINKIYYEEKGEG